MGECGCGQDCPEVRIDGADGYHYGIELYPGCRYCDTPVAVTIHRYGDEAASDMLEHIPAPDIRGDDYYGAFPIPILDPKHLRAALLNMLPEADALDEYDVREAVRVAMDATRAEWNALDPNGAPA